MLAKMVLHLLQDPSKKDKFKSKETLLKSETAVSAERERDKQRNNFLAEHIKMSCINT